MDFFTERAYPMGMILVKVVSNRWDLKLVIPPEEEVS